MRSTCQQPGRSRSRRALLAVLPVAVALAPSWASAQAADQPSLAQAVADAGRSPKFVARDPARHPLEELTFYGVRPDSRVVEILPGGGYWTEILAPFLRESGHYTVALPEDGATPQARLENQDAVRTFRAKLAAAPARYERVGTVSLDGAGSSLGPPGSADFVLTFRNLHNWMEDGSADAVLAGFFRVLKPGGVLGIEDHRGNTTRPQSPRAEDGYVRQQTAIDLAKRAGFEFVAASEIDANPRDTADWPEGVWTLPPTLRLGDKDRARYEAIGEADNFVLKFRKP